VTVSPDFSWPPARNSGVRQPGFPWPPCPDFFMAADTRASQHPARREPSRLKIGGLAWRSVLRKGISIRPIQDRMYVFNGPAYVFRVTNSYKVARSGTLVGKKHHLANVGVVVSESCNQIEPGRPPTPVLPAIVFSAPTHWFAPVPLPHHKIRRSPNPGRLPFLLEGVWLPQSGRCHADIALRTEPTCDLPILAAVNCGQAGGVNWAIQ
jgi:hypothetical protein